MLRGCPQEPPSPCAATPVSPAGGIIRPLEEIHFLKSFGSLHGCEFLLNILTNFPHPQKQIERLK